SGAGQMCIGGGGVPAVHGYLPTWREPALWGGYATHVYVDPDTVLYRFPASLDPLTATLWNPLAGGIQWSVLTPGTTIGTTIVVAGIKAATMPDFPIARIVARNLRLIGVNRQGDTAYRRAAELVAAGRLPFEKLRTHVFGLDRFVDALDTLQGRVPGERAINVV